MKLAVYAIAKNEAKHVERWYESVKDADEIIVLDTGSTDGTQKMLADLGVRVGSMSFDPFRFDTARNSALNLVGHDVDYCMFLDLDETLPAGSIKTIREALRKHPSDMYGVRLVFTFDEQRRPKVSYPREAIHRRNGFYWKYPVHELLASYEPSYSYLEIPVDVYHEPDTEKSRGSYLELLETAVEENPDDPRCVQYLGREYMYQGRPFDAIQWLKRHIQIEPHGPFRSESAGYIAQCYLSMDGQLEEALDECESWMHRAIAEFNSAREPYCELAKLYFQCGEFECAVGMIRSALRIETAPTVAMIHTDEYYQHWCYHMLAACYHNMGMPKAAQQNITEAMKRAPKIDGALATDLARILGIPNASQPVVVEPEAGTSLERSVPQDGEEQADLVPETLPEEHAPLSFAGEAVQS